ETGGIRVAGGFLSLGEGELTRVASAQGRKSLGIRPDFISIVPAPEADLVGTVAEVLDRGDDCIIAVEVEGQRLLIRGDDEVSPCVGETLNLALNRSFMRFFDDDIAIEFGSGDSESAA